VGRQEQNAGLATDSGIGCARFDCSHSLGGLGCRNLLAIPRKSRYNIPIQFWRCPHCGFEHSAADLLRSGWSTFKCKQCGKDFPSGKQ
jgi:rubredoxin